MFCCVTQDKSNQFYLFLAKFSCIDFYFLNLVARDKMFRWQAKVLKESYLQRAYESAIFLAKNLNRRESQEYIGTEGDGLLDAIIYCVVTIFQGIVHLL